MTGFKSVNLCYSHILVISGNKAANFLQLVLEDVVAALLLLPTSEAVERRRRRPSTLPTSEKAFRTEWFAKNSPALNAN